MSRANVRSLWAFARRFQRDANGVAAVEFALLIPVLLLIYFGLAEFCQAYMAQKRAQHTASQVADMVARAPTITEEEIEQIMDVGSLIMQPFPEAPLSIRLTNITRDNNGVARVVWSIGTGQLSEPLRGVQTVPAGLIGNNETIIMGETVYLYDSPLGDILPAATEYDRLLPEQLRFEGQHYLRPRLTDRLPCTDCPTP